jgi:DNA-binding protein HU-beta
VPLHSLPASLPLAVSLVGFGSFGTSVRSARMARNPRTGEPIQVPETTVATFAPSKVLKDKVGALHPGSNMSRRAEYTSIFTC